MKRLGLNLFLVVALLAGFVLATTLGETRLSLDQYLQAFTQPGSAPWEILWSIRAPRAAAAAVVGACLGLSGALMQGLLRNPLADPGVLGVSASAALGAALTIVLGLAVVPGAVEASALVGAALAGACLLLFAARFPEPEALILFGVALSSFAGAVTALVFNLSPSPIATAEVLAWMLGSVENRNWGDVAWGLAPLGVAVVLAAHAGRGLLALTLGEDTAATLGLPMRRLKLAAVAAASIATGASVAMAGVIGFVGLASPHLVRAAVREDPSRLLVPSALAGALMLVLADLAARMAPTEVELKLGVFTALVGAPLFAFVAWRAARSWRS
ncbi:iron ABC transporter permease [Caulobacter sp. 17J65-9]|uniref:FecCD family ABC transporter permease n=1 Tax=Caulobacter sp. 17J65-9 TaxID=2709382 RepID=UPI0013C5D44F|nr:iron ABC transporter permease [Caulobacter sp. 17J65-9]NEX94483.1 iron ABC transporter permease [Caulobacter sp. 17J65-9]